MSVQTVGLKSLFDTLRDVVTCAEGTIEMLQAEKVVPPNDGKTFLVSCAEDRDDWDRFAAQGLPVV